VVTPDEALEQQLKTIEAMVHDVHLAGLARSRDPLMVFLLDSENANCMTSDVMDIVRRVMKLFGPHVFVAVLTICCVFKPAIAAPQLIPPSAPSSLAAESSTSTSIQLDWLTHGSASGIAIERRIATTTYAEIARVGGAIELYFDIGLVTGKQYSYRIRAYNRRGHKYAYSTYSNEASTAPVQIPALTPTPTLTPAPPPTATYTPAAPTPTSTPIIPTPTPIPPIAACEGTDFYGLCLKTLKSFATQSKEQGHPDTVTPASAWHGPGLVTDLRRSPIGIYVVDKSTSRIRGYDGWPADRLAPPAVVLGGRGLACNGDDNLGSLTNPGPDTLCLMGYPLWTNTGEQWGAINPEVDLDGNVYMPDEQNDRVVVYYQPLSADKTGGRGDGVADAVYGQPDLYSNGPNRRGPVGPDTLNLTGALGATHSGSPTIDSNSNVYIADTGNHRVVIAPKGSRVGTVFLGQKSGTAAVATDCSPPGPTIYALDKTCNPTMARVDESTGELWVTDETSPMSGSGHGPFEARILVFTPPFTTGMAATRQIKPTLDKPMTPDGYVYYFTSKGFRFNTHPAYPTGKIWNTEHYPSWRRRVELLDADGQFVTIINAHNKYEKADWAYNSTLYPGCGAWDNPPEKIGNPSGTLAFDDAGNILLFDETRSFVGKYALPYVMDANNCIPTPAALLGQRNTIGPANIDGSTGVNVIGSQLVVSDRNRLMVWDGYMTKPTNAPADFAVGQPDLYTRGQGALSLSDRHEVTTDDLGHMWGINSQGRWYVFALPLFPGQIQLASWMSTYWQGRDLDPPISLFNPYGAIFDPWRKVIWFADNSRLLRISDYANFASGRVHIDAVLGKSDTTSTTCTAPSQTTFCSARRLKLDRLGNLYVIENDYECKANNRISMIRSTDLDAIGPPQANIIFPTVPISKVWTRQRLGNDFNWFGSCSQGPDTVDYPSSPITVAFDSQNHMMVGNDGYYAQLHQTERAWKQLWWYPNPLVDLNPTASIRLPMGAVGGLDFDEQDRLIVQDHTWSRVWVIDPQEPGWLVPIL